MANLTFGYRLTKRHSATGKVPFPVCFAPRVLAMATLTLCQFAYVSKTARRGHQFLAALQRNTPTGVMFNLFMRQYRF